jgi:hypothetical protein
MPAKLDCIHWADTGWRASHCSRAAAVCGIPGCAPPDPQILVDGCDGLEETGQTGCLGWKHRGQFPRETFRRFGHVNDEIVEMIAVTDPVPCEARGKPKFVQQPAQGAVRPEPADILNAGVENKAPGRAAGQSGLARPGGAGTAGPVMAFDGQNLRPLPGKERRRREPADTSAGDHDIVPRRAVARFS